MRGNSSSSSYSSSSSKPKNGALDIEKLKEPHLSGAYIRSLVKQLSSSRTKDSPNSEDSPNSKDSPNFDQKPEKSIQTHKKQVRRRLHTSRPYQERLLNMAEARREIVTALKFHRASMKQASEKQQQQETEQEAKLKSRRNPRIYASNSNSSIPDQIPTNFLDNNYSYSSPGFITPYSWPISPIPPPPPLAQDNNLNFTLPSQALGLNLNLNIQDFNNLDSNFNYSTNPSSIYSSSSPSTSSSPEAPCMVVPPSMAAELGDSGLHPVMDDKEIAEIRSIGEQYEMEWNDTLNLVNSAWWFKFLKATEIGPEYQRSEEFLNGPFDEVMEFPAWLNANENENVNVNDFCSDYYFDDPALPCMDIEEIEGMDGDWLA